MSHAFVLVKFKTTGNIYYGLYSGNTDVTYPFICTPLECYDEMFDCFDPKSYCMTRGKECEWRFPDNVTDLDDVEIYSDYGGGFYWDATGSESLKMIDAYYELDDPCYPDLTNGMPVWVKEFLEQQNYIEP